MAKTKTAFFCRNCGAEAAKWIGKCPACGEWNTYVEEVVEKGGASGVGKGTWRNHTDKPQPVSLTDISVQVQPRLHTQDAELNRVLGGGIVPGSLVLIAGEPGIGKSTLLLQTAVHLPQETILYVSGEESEQQIKMRADRLGISNDRCFLFTETIVEQILNAVKTVSPTLLIIDSIQTLQSNDIQATAGSISQIRECAGILQRFAKESGISVFLIGHITKDGSIAGPKLLEHIVDAVLHFEGDQHHSYRLLRTFKNRFGSTAEIGIYEMKQEGLRQVSNPSELLISQHDTELSGISIAATMEGQRPLLIETQALVSRAVYGTPQRSTTGFDLRRLHMLLAVLDKRCGFKLGDKDAFINIAGGLKVEDPAIDLSVIASLLSSYEDIPLPPRTCFSGEVGLSGEVRSVTRIEQRLAEAEKLGFRKIFVSSHFKGIPKNSTLEIIQVSTVRDLYDKVFS
ncbi:MAG: DNA repair protein RadA [Sphingobacteriales bacterium]|nr:DNA repair protein RadA [Sphingobacteriales bacterium]